MKLPAKASVDFEIAPAGNHVAICNAVIDLGVQKGRGIYPDPKHEIYIRFELPTERVKYVKDGHEVEGPMSVGRRFTASMSQKANLRKFIESWFGKAFGTDEAASDFDVALLLSRKCLLNITHSDKGDKKYANIANATPIPKGMPAEFSQHNQSISFDLTSSDQQTFNLLPEWLQKTINERLDDRLEDKSQKPATNNGAPFDDDIPF